MHTSRSNKSICWQGVYQLGLACQK